MIAPGKHSTEHARAWRAEVLGGLLVTLGLYLGSTAMLAIGAALVGAVAIAYSFARSAPKAAAVRRPADQPTRRV